METAINDPDISAIKAIIEPIFGKTAWNVKLGYGSFITLNFGQALAPNAQGQIFGEWFLWVEHCAWRIESKTDVIAASEDDREALENNVKVLENRFIEGIQIQKPSLEAIIVFSGSIYFRTFA